jgi:capsular exopolysaccharide synthesis family protein
MSRIEEALRRSHRSDTSQATLRNRGGESFRSPWDFSGTEVVVLPTEAETVVAAESVERSPVEQSHVPAWVAQPSVNNPVRREGAVIGGFNSEWKQRLVTAEGNDPFLVEQFRRLAATLHQARAVSEIKSVMVTSASPNDGKTLTAINLALILSESYRRRVLLIDADLRRPSIRDVSHMPDVIGLSDGLRATTEQKLTVFRLTETLSLLPAGRPDPDPMGSLTSTRMRRILVDACNRFDWVVVDAPPVGTVSDASLLAEMVDGSLLVVRAGQTDCSLTQKAIEAIGRERILGVVLNGAEIPPTDREYYRTYAATDKPE